MKKKEKTETGFCGGRARRQGHCVGQGVRAGALCRALHEGRGIVWGMM